MHRYSFFVLASACSAALVLWPAGCVGDADTPKPTMAPFCAALADSFCEAMFACCVDGSVLLDFNAGRTVDECKRNWSAGGPCIPYWIPDVPKAVEDGHAIFDPALLAPCIAHLEALTPGEYACVQPPLGILLTECLTALRPQIAVGEACDAIHDGSAGVFSFVECKDGLCVNSKCVPFLKMGEACPTGGIPSKVPPDQTCNFPEGEWCNGAGDAGTCGLRGEVGDACTPGHAYECRSLACDKDAGTCVPSAKPGSDGYGCKAL